MFSSIPKTQTIHCKHFGPRSLCPNPDNPTTGPRSVHYLPPQSYVPRKRRCTVARPRLTLLPLHSGRILAINSRGDVQPYIALARGLMADGHRVKIATHGEFQAWIESHGIEYGYVGGDPAELMRICIENGAFTVAFWKEGVLRVSTPQCCNISAQFETQFRGWLDDLLKTSWEACRGTDVLVKSPSAMGGYHTAEALRIPYFRAFTMTWTRTR
ncbi:hypothetical protein J3R83DRAFT_7786 [Lanmaoa asiatica]|nr:hypothetical protein J3R83DRAFT_7786 [Lanmaoa asiatica]